MLLALTVWVVGSLASLVIASLVFRTTVLERRRVDEHEAALRASNPTMYQSMIDLQNRFDRARDAT